MAKDPTRVAAGRRSQRKGRRAELQDIKWLRGIGYTVYDKRDLEAAGVETGADYEIRDLHISAQRKGYAKGNGVLLRKGALAEWRKLETVAQLRGHQPMMHWYEGQGAGNAPLDLVVLRWETVSEWLEKLQALQSSS
jgi:hypothetical protein